MPNRRSPPPRPGPATGPPSGWPGPSTSPCCRCRPPCRHHRLPPRQKHILQPTGTAARPVDQALPPCSASVSASTWPSAPSRPWRSRTPSPSRDVVGRAPAGRDAPAHRRGARAHLIELGEDGRLLRLQLAELVDGRRPVRRLVVRDYVSAGGPGSDGSADGAGSSGRRRPGRPVHRGAGRRLQGGVRSWASRNARRPRLLVEPRGYRLLHRLPRFSDIFIDRIVERFARLQKIMRASVGDLEEVGGVGRPGRARSRTAWPAWPRPASSSATAERRHRAGRALLPAGQDRRAGASGTMVDPPCRSCRSRPFQQEPGDVVFDIGDKVVYPHHGAAIVERRETKEAFGEKRSTSSCGWPTGT